MADLDANGIRPASRSYTDDFRPTKRRDEYEVDPADADRRSLQPYVLRDIVNTAIAVGRGTVPLKDLTRLVEPLGLRRVK